MFVEFPSLRVVPSNNPSNLVLVVASFDILLGVAVPSLCWGVSIPDEGGVVLFAHNRWDIPDWTEYW
jgi:hypothetical protein